MPVPSPTAKLFGDSLVSPGILQPNLTLHIDAYGVAQGQATFALDSDQGNIASAITHFTAGVNWPESSIGFPMTSYKYAIATSKGGIAMMTVDYMGIQRGAGYSDAQITGVANTTAQPIETHPNFTTVTDETIGDGETPIAGWYTDDKAHLENNALFVEVLTNGKNPVSYSPQKQYKFIGFGVDGAGNVNIKAGIRQFLRPMVNVRGTIFFNSTEGYRAAIMTDGVGRTLPDMLSVHKLITPNDIIGAVSNTDCLLTAANAECIGKPGNYAAIKVTYDIMIGGEIGWDTDIYGEIQTSIFS